MEEIVLVSPKNRYLGICEKIETHEKGLLHRAFSVFVFNSRGELLIQRRALSKYHSGGLWSNTCCGHPRPKERLLIAAKRRLFEEMGFGCKLKKVGVINYCAELGELVENEIDYIIVGKSDSEQVNFNTDEVMEYRWVSLGRLKSEIRESPKKFTHWFRLILDDDLTGQLFG